MADPKHSPKHRRKPAINDRFLDGILADVLAQVGRVEAEDFDFDPVPHLEWLAALAERLSRRNQFEAATRVSAVYANRRERLSGTRGSLLADLAIVRGLIEDLQDGRLTG